MCTPLWVLLVGATFWSRHQCGRLAVLAIMWGVCSTFQDLRGGKIEEQKLNTYVEGKLF